MEIITDPLVDANFKQKKKTELKCSFCSLHFDNRIDWNQHILEHFVRKSCSDCDKNILQIGDNWYELHITVNCSKITDDNMEGTFREEVKVESLEEINQPTDDENFSESVTYSTLEKNKTESPTENTELMQDDPLQTKKSANVGFDVPGFQRVQAKTVTGQKIWIAKCLACSKHFAKTAPKELKSHRSVCKMPDTGYNYDEFDKVFPHDRTRIMIERIQSLGFVKRLVTKSNGDEKVHAECKQCRKVLANTQEHTLKAHTRKCKSIFSYLKFSYEEALDENTSNVACIHCQMEFRSPPLIELRKHRSECNANPTTPYKSNNTANADDSTNRFDDVSKYICAYCYREYDLSHNLKQHIDREHMNKTPQVCSICVQEFTNADELLEHIQATHEFVPRLDSITDDSVSEVKFLMLNLQDFDKLYATDISETKISSASTGVYGYVCAYCHVEFAGEKYAKRHIVKQHGADVTQFCSICQNSFDGRDALLSHMETNHEFITPINHGIDQPAKQYCLINIEHVENMKKTLTCNYCNKLCPTIQYLQDHLRVHTRERPFGCNICHLTFTQQGSLTKHEREVHHLNPYKCNIEGCNEAFPLKTLLQKHQKSVHAELFPKGKIFNCTVCDKKFEFEYYLKIHQNTHTGVKPFICNICGQRYTSPGTLEAHKRIKHLNTPTKKERLKCSFEGCNRTFEKETSRDIHLLGHDPTAKRFKCKTCGSSFVTQRRLNEHSQRIHSGLKRFMCTVCGKTFGQRGALTLHSTIHTGERNHKCPICNKLFSKRTTMMSHQRVHTGEKPNKCPIEGCDRAYMYDIDLKRHKFSAHGIYTKKHPCTICGKIFPENKILRKHLQSHK